MRLLKLLSLSAALVLGAVGAGQAQTYPERVVRIVVPYPPAGATDIVGRILADRLSQKLGQTFIVENRPGAAGMSGSDAVAKSTPDGYTILVGSIANTIYPATKKSVPYDLQKDLVPLCQVISVPNYLVVGTDSPYKTLGDLIADAKAKPGQLTFASTGSGASPHLSGEMLKVMAGIDIIHVPYKGSGPAMIDLMPGRVTLMFDNAALPYVKQGKLRALAISSAARSPAAPEIPTLAEAGVPGYALSSWYGLWAPKGTPDAIVQLLQKNIAQVFAEPDVQEKVSVLGGQADVICGADFAKFIDAQMEKWVKLAQDANIPKE